MLTKNKLMYLCIAGSLVSNQAFSQGAGWGSVSVSSGGTAPSAVVIKPTMNAAQRQGILKQKNQLVAKKKQYQVLIQQVTQNMSRRPDLRAQLLVQLRNYKAKEKGVDTQLAQVNKRLQGASVVSQPAPQRPRINADNNAVVALAAQFGLKSKALVHFPELIKAKNDKEKKVIIKKKLSKTGYRTSTRNSSAVIDDRLLFSNGSAELFPAARQRVANLAALYHRFGNEINRIVVRGHTNSIGDNNYNLQLSRARSNKVKAELMKLRVPASAVVSQGFGENELLPNINPSSPLNRRVEYGVIKR